MADLTPTPRERINIHEGIQWKDADGRVFQSWDVYEAVKNERDRLREAIIRVDDFLADYDADLTPRGSTQVSGLRLLIDDALGRELIR